MQNMLDQVLNALQNPSADHIQIYAALGIGIAVIAFILYSAMGTKDVAPEHTFTLGDVVTDPIKDEGEEKTAFLKELDQKGPYERKMGGQLTMDALLKLRSIINKRAYSKFVPRKLEMMEERLGYFKAKNMQKYVESIKQSASEYEVIIKEASLDALRHLDITEKDFEASFLEARSNPEMMVKLQKSEENVRLEVDKPKELIESKDEIKQMYMQKIKMDFDVEMKLAGKQVSSKEEAQQLMMIERTQVMDALYLKYKIKLTDLLRAINSYNLEEDPDVKALKNANAGAKMQAKQKMEEAMKLKPEQEKMIATAVEQAGPIKPLNQSNTLEFDDHVKIQSVISKMGILIMETKNVTFKTERRKLLEEKKEVEY